MAAPGQAPQPIADRFVRYVNRDNTHAASLKNQAIVVETTAYTNFEQFLDIAMRVVDARSQVSSIVGIERIGLRYVLEIRVPAGVDGRIEWTNWIDESLLGPQRVAPGGLLLTEWQGAAVYREAQPGKSTHRALRPGRRSGTRCRIPPAPGDAGSGRTVLPDGHRQLLDSAHRRDPGIQPGSAACRPTGSCTPRRRRSFQDMLTARLKDELLRTQ